VAGSLISIALSGFLIGALARLALPGPDPMPFWLTVLVGLGGSIVGGGIAAGIYGARHTFDSSNHAFVTLLLEVGAAVAIVGLYRRYVQQRPLSGPDARRFPSRGVGIERMRSRLRQLGIDPDRVTGPPGTDARLEDRSGDEIAAELEKLREQREAGAISQEEYDLARERLRRY
jgi:uncharacterized membrane protein YeaQ/YmgE (transglycosylase-associated protein family)